MSETQKKTKIKKKPKKLINIIFSRKTTIIILMALQLLFLFLAFFRLSEKYTYLQIAFTVISVLIAFNIINSDENPAYKMAWLVPLLAFPLFTTVFYLLMKNQFSTRKVRFEYEKKCANTRAYLPTDTALMEKIKEEDKDFYKLAGYLDTYGGYPVCKNTDVTYFPLGDHKFKAMAEELKKAQNFIFIEYFIIDDGEMWTAISDILLEKLSQGVEVRLLYDGMGSQFIIPTKIKKKLVAAGAKVHVFNPFRPMLSTIQNNRDHRKILVIDGNVAFTGGVNIADEYINRIERFGHWKDNAVMLKGEGVWNFTMMFLQMWEVVSRDIAQYDMYRPAKTDDIIDNGYVIPFGDSPLDKENVGELVYMDIINNAKDYVYITTPYFVPDNEMLTALYFAAKTGVDVRIITPGIPDKWYVYSITQSYYKELISHGIKVYEYKPGFIHAKTFLSDDKTAVVGTINLDYRSLFLHFECAAYMHKTSCIKDIKADFNDLFENKCKRITLEDCKKRSVFSRICSVVLKAIAPLL